MAGHPSPVRLPALVAAVTFAAAIAADLATKAAFVASDAGSIVYNARPADLLRRIAMSLVAIAVTFALARAAHWRGIGRIWGAWIGVGALVGGVLGNGVSRLVWERGVPDFIGVGGREVWNLADFEIALGLSGGIVSVGVAALIAYGRWRIRNRRGAVAQP